MKKGSLFSLVVCLSVLFVSCGSQMKNAVVAVNLSSDLFEKAFPERLIASAADSDVTEEIYSAELTVTGGYNYSNVQQFTKDSDVSFRLENLISGISIDLALDLKYNDKVLYSGEVKDYIVESGTNEITLTLKPTAEFNPFTQVYITYETNFGELALKSKIVKIGYKLTEEDLSALSAENMVFDGWFIGDSVAVAGTEIIADTVLTAKWSEEAADTEPEITTAKVTFVYGDKSEEKEFDIGYVLTADDLPAVDESLLSDFTGWYDDAGNKVEAGYVIKADVKIMAKNKNAKYTVTFDTDGGSEVEAVTVDYAHFIGKDKVKNPTKEGFVFGGWYLNDAVYNMEKVVTADITLKAKWDVKEDEFPEIELSMSMNGKSVVNGGKVLEGFENLVLAVDSVSNNNGNTEFVAKMVVGDKTYETDSSRGLGTRVEMKQFLNNAVLPAGTYTISVSLKKRGEEVYSKNVKDFSFTVVDKTSVNFDLDKPCPEFKFINSQEENDRTKLTIKTTLEEYETILDDYGFEWQIDGKPVAKGCTSIVISTDGKINGIPTLTLTRGYHTVKCIIKNLIIEQYAIEEAVEYFSIN